MFAQIAHAVNCVCSDWQEDLLGIRLLSAAVQRKSDRTRCLRPAICMLARHTNDGSKSSQQEAGSRASPWQAPGFVCFPSPYMYALSPFRSDREGPSSKILKGKARTLASLSAWSVLLKLPSETRVNLELVWPPFRLSMCNGRRAEAERKELKIAFGPQTNNAFGPKTKSWCLARQFFFLSTGSLSFSSLFLFLVAEERADHSWFAKGKHKHTKTDRDFSLYTFDAGRWWLKTPVENYGFWCWQPARRWWLKT